MSGDDLAGVSSVADTARWVAYYRAQESERPDALFRDPLARELAGDVGKRMAELNRSARSGAWAMNVRTALIDEIVMREVSGGGCDAVLVLGAGLDARPYRLALPAALRWIEVDFPDMIAYKTEKLRGVEPVCRLERVGLDLADAETRRALFARIDRDCARVLVLSEGLIIYLAEEQVAALGRDLHDQPHFALWLVDQSSPAIMQMISRGYSRGLQAARAPMRFAPASGLAFHAAQGWQPREMRDMIEEARRLGREMPLAWLFRAFGMLRPRHAKYWSAIALLARA